MPVVDVVLYDFDPVGVFATTVGGTTTYGGPATATGTATITDNEVGAGGLVLDDDDAGGETATADVTIGGATSTGSNVDAEEAWTLLDTTTGETFQMVTFQVEDGPAAGYYTLSEIPLVPGHTYEVIAYDTNPDGDAGDPAFTFSDYAAPVDGIVTGTSGDDTIDGSYVGDPDGDVVDGADNINSTPADLEFNWSDFGDETDLTGGVTQDTGGINVGITYTNEGATSPNFSVETSNTTYVAGGETFDTNSAGYVYGIGNGDNATVEVDFSAVDGAGLAPEVSDVEFRINDIDGLNDGTNNFQDIVTITAFDADGNPVPVTITISGDDSLSGDTVTGNMVNHTEGDVEGSILVEIAGPVASIVIDYNNGGSTQQAIYISDIHFTTIPLGDDADTIDAGAGNDVIDAGADNDVVYGGTGDDTIIAGAGDDTLHGGDDQDTIELGDGFGDDTITGGEGGTDNDTLDATGLTGGTTTTLTGDEAGVLTAADGSTATFTEIEEFELTGSDDIFDGSAATTAMDVAGGGGADQITGGSGDDTLNGGDGADTLVGGDGADTLVGGDGDDIIELGDGDVATGGNGDDTFTIDPTLLAGGGTISVTGGEGDEDSGGDTLDFGGMLAPGGIVYSNPDDAAGGLSGTATLIDGTIVNFTEIENIICFTRDTKILTLRGQRAVQDLRPGDMVMTRDRGPQPIRWVGARSIIASPELAPIEFAPGAIGNVDFLRVSPQHRMLVDDYRAQLYFGETEVLVAAKHLINGTDIRQCAPGTVSYYHVLFDQHEVIYADEGIATESYHPGAYSLPGLAPKAREELFQIFPELRANPIAYGQSARLCVTAQQGRLLTA